MATGFRVRYRSAGTNIQGERVLFQLPIRIGRNPLNDCQLPHDQISDFHASVEFVNGQLCVRDLNSRNGVYASTGGRLPPNAPVPLASMGHSFIVNPAFHVQVEVFEQERPVGARLGGMTGNVLGNRVVLEGGVQQPSGFGPPLGAPPQHQQTPQPARPPSSPPPPFQQGTPAQPVRPPGAQPQQQQPPPPGYQAHPIRPRTAPPPANQPSPVYGAPPPPQQPAPMHGAPPPPAYSAYGPPPAPPQQQPQPPQPPPPQRPSSPPPAYDVAALPPLSLDGRSYAARPAPFEQPQQPAASPDFSRGPASFGLPQLAPVPIAFNPGGGPAPYPPNVAPPPPQPQRGAGVSLGTQHFSMGVEMMAFLGLQELASSLVPGVTLGTTGDVARLLTKLHDTVEIFCRCFVPLRDGYSQFISQMDLRQAASQRILNRSNSALQVEAARDPATVAAALLDWRNQDYDAPRAVESIFADLIIHQLALLEGVMRGVQALLDELSPEKIEHLLDEGGNQGVSAVLGRYRALWKTYQTHYEEMTNETRTFELVFGSEFAASYRDYLSRREKPNP